MLAVLLAAALVAGCRVAGSWLEASGVDLHLGQTWPLLGHWRDTPEPGLVVAVLVAVGAVWLAPRCAASLRWGWLLVGAYLSALAWALALALSEGTSGLTYPMSYRAEYVGEVARVDDLSRYLPAFTDHIMGEPKWAAHVGGHPPGAFGIFLLLDRVGLAGPLWAGLSCAVIGAAAVPAVLSTVRVIGAESLARRAAPFVAFAPAALWIAASADAVFMAVSASGICALAHAARRRDRWGDLLAAAGGIALGGSLFFSYGLMLLGPLAAAVVLARRRIRPLVIGGIAVLAVFAAYAAGGFLWWEGLALTIERVHWGPA
ncbi:MAG: hypothetical protein ACRDT8_22805, partial [Micromonosporaceae bacterium]